MLRWFWYFLSRYQKWLLNVQKECHRTVIRNGPEDYHQPLKRALGYNTSVLSISNRLFQSCRFLSVMIVSMTTVWEQAANGLTFCSPLLFCNVVMVFYIQLFIYKYQFYKTLSPAYREMKAQVRKGTFFFPKVIH